MARSTIRGNKDVELGHLLLEGKFRRGSGTSRRGTQGPGNQQKPWKISDLVNRKEKNGGFLLYFKDLKKNGGSDTSRKIKKCTS